VTGNSPRSWWNAPGTFVGVLQPVAYFSRTKLDHIRLSKATELQYNSVYPLMRQKVAQSGGEFHDRVDAMDVDEYAYVDWCHLSPNGNRHLVRRIANVAARLGFKP
jgi:hypothetical protein